MSLRASCLALSLAATALAPARAFADDDLPFLGRWDCEVAEFTFTPDTYNNGSDDLPILEIQEGFQPPLKLRQR